MTGTVDFDLIESEKFILKGRFSADEVYADGFSQIMFGHPTSKILFHTTVAPLEGNRELRKASQYLTLNTVTAIEMAHLILTFAKKSEERLMKDLDEKSQKKVEKILADFHSTVFQAGVEEAATPSKAKRSIKKI